MHGKKGFKQVLERSDGVLGFSKTKFYFEQKKIDQKLANRHAELPIGYSCRIIWIYIKSIGTDDLLFGLFRLMERAWKVKNGCPQDTSH